MKMNSEHLHQQTEIAFENREVSRSLTTCELTAYRPQNGKKGTDTLGILRKYGGPSRI